MTTSVRHSRPADAATISEIEAAADTLLIQRFDAADWPPPATDAERSALPGFLLVAEVVEDAAPPVAAGFVHVLEIDGHAHLEQLSVHPAHGRRGIGRRLVRAALDEARERGHERVTLRTYADVPWNAPFYASCGFVESEPDSAFHRRLIATEEALQLSAHGRRVQMTIAF
ncbi:GNAT family N-acetyltransferase [Microbacterium sp. LWH11-1.2]|uniref:GNAT family N-acetyltransferase n=1 Tax=Microbacterium sp. LWH11-1.2 TaxID=3135258 RepID=UPI003138E974